ncbi:hypothetical protein IJH27_01150 [Candidatus Saccharibacteria bacterium]|nr:hypothetical protein [Candidatus Saccharibacteria bacterium]
MYKLAPVVQEIFKKYVGDFEKKQVRFDLDFFDPTMKVASPSKVREALEFAVCDSLLRTRARDAVEIKVSRDKIEIKDNAEKVFDGRETPDGLKARARVGVGTSFSIGL